MEKIQEASTSGGGWVYSNLAMRKDRCSKIEMAVLRSARHGAGFTAAFCLAICPTLAQAAGILYLPRVQSDQAFETGLAFASTESRPGTISISAYSSTGQLVKHASFSVSAHGQIVGTAPALLGLSSDFIGWARIDSDVDVQGMCLLFRRSDGLLSEAPAVKLPDGTQYLAHVAVGGGWQTEVSVANTSSVATTAQFIVFDQLGTVLATQTLNLPPLGDQIVDVRSLMGTATLPGGHIEIFSSQPLATAETFLGGNLLATIAGEGNTLSGSDGKWSILFPNVTTASGYFTGLAYLNQSAATAFVDLTLFDQSGTAVFYREDILGPKVQRAINVADLAQGWNGSGYVLLTSNSPISGLQVVGTPQERLFGWEGVRDFARELFVPHIAETGQWASTLSLVNPSPSPIQVTFDAFDSNGQTIHTGQIQLDANVQSTITVGSLTGLAGQSGGSLRLTASAPVVAANAIQSNTGVASLVASPAADVGSRFVPAAGTASATISAATGGTLTVPSPSPNITLGGLTLVIPPGALSEDTQVQVTYTLPTMIDPDRTSQLVQYPIRLLPEGLHILKPAQLTIPVYSGLLANFGNSINGVTVARHDDLTKAWVGAPVSSRDSTGSTVIAQIDSLGDYVATIPAGQLAIPPQSAAPTLRASILLRPLDASSTFNSACIGLDQIGAIDALQNSLPVSISKLVDWTCASITAGTQFSNGDVTGGLYTLGTHSVDVAATEGVSALCLVLAAPATAAAAPVAKLACDGFAAEAVNVATYVGEYLGDRASDLVSADRNIAAFNNQVQRYVGWLKAGIPPNAIPKCSGGFYPDSALGTCQPPDDVWCSKFNPLIFIGAETPSYPCNPLAQDDYYTSDAVAQFATVVFKEMPKLGQSASDLKNALISLGQQLTPKLTASFIVTPGIQGTAPFQISVDATASAPQATITGYFWNFGDGTSATGVRASHTYAVAGPYTITLKITASGTIGVATNNIVALQSTQTTPTTSQSSPPVVSLQQSTLTVPGSVNLNGSGFLARTPVVVSAVGEPGPVYSSAPILTDVTGNLAYTFTFDASTPPSKYDVLAREQTSSPRYSNTLTLTLTSQSSPPSASVLSPATVSATSSGQTGNVVFVISGTGFRPGAFVRISFASAGTYGGVPHSAGDTAATISPNQIAADGSSLNFSTIILYAGSYSVFVVNADGRSTSPLTLVVTPASTGSAPPTPTGLSPGGSSPPGPAVNTLTPTLTWNASTGATQYSVAVLNVSTGATVVAPTVTTSSFTTPTLQTGVTYIWSVLASNSVGSSAPSAGVYFTVNIASAPPPTIASVQPSNVSASSNSQLLTIVGTGFQSGLTATITSPTNSILTFSGGQLQNFSQTTFQISVLLNTAGTWTVAVKNPDGNSSSPSAITVTPQANLSLNFNSWPPRFTVGDAPTSIGLTITSSSGGFISGTATATTANVGPWLTVDGHTSDTWTITPSVGPSTSLTLTADPSGLSPGAYNGNIVVNAPNASNATLNVTVTMTILAKLQILTSSLPTATWGQSYSYQLQATGGSGYTWSLQSGTGSSLPPNLTLSSSGLISGTLVSANSSSSWPFTVIVTDSAGRMQSANLVLQVPAPIVITSTAPSSFQFIVGQSYTAVSGSSITFQATGGTSPYSWSATNPPPGLHVDTPSGALLGTPTQQGMFATTVTATDSTGRSGSAAFNLVVIMTPLVITSANLQPPPVLASGTVGLAYTGYLDVTGGSNSGYQWNVSGFPPGISGQMNPTASCAACSYMISGTPTQPGNYALAVRVTDSLNNSATATVTLLINSGTPPTITTTTLTLASVGQAYSFSFSATSGTPPYQWSFNGASPDPSLQLLSSGVLQGTSSMANDCPTGPAIWIGNQPPFGSFSSAYFQVKVTDSAGQSTNKQFCLPAYYPTPQITSLNPSSVTADGQSHTVTVNGSNFRSSAHIYNAGNGAPNFVNSNALSFTLTPAPPSCTNLNTGFVFLLSTSACWAKGTETLWIVQPYSYVSNQVTFTVN
jgi:hypothetical protein